MFVPPQAHRRLVDHEPHDTFPGSPTHHHHRHSAEPAVRGQKDGKSVCQVKWRIAENHRAGEQGRRQHQEGDCGDVRRVRQGGPTRTLHPLLRRPVLLRDDHHWILTTTLRRMLMISPNEQIKRLCTYCSTLIGNCIMISSYIPIINDT